LLEPVRGKPARPVLKGPRRSNALGLPDHHDVEVQDETGRRLGRGPGCRRGWPARPGCMRPALRAKQLTQPAVLTAAYAAIVRARRGRS
jgi:hypothetical protein